jgi:hypothetical protein
MGLERSLSTTIPGGLLTLTTTLQCTTGADQHFLKSCSEIADWQFV